MLRGSHLHKPHVMIAVVARRKRLSADTDNFVFLRVVLVMHYAVDARSRYFVPRFERVSH
jgi:hypothetical protein